MAKPTAQQCHALTTLYINAYADEHGSKPSVNRNTARWGFDSILTDLPPVEARELVEYFVHRYPGQTLDWFFYNYDKLVVERKEREIADEARRARLKETRERARKWHDEGNEHYTELG